MLKMNSLAELYCTLGSTTKPRHYKSLNQLMVPRGRVKLTIRHRKCIVNGISSKHEYMV